MKYGVGGLRRLLPQGRTLPHAEWRRRHLGLVILLWAHAVAVPIYATVRGYPFQHVLTESALLPAAGLIASFDVVSQRVRMIATSLGLLTASGILVHLSGGLIEMHFHFFVMVAVVALYQDWLPFLGAIAYVAIHHGVVGVLDPKSVFNHPAAQNNPWKWAGIHAAFIGAISVACLVGWRLNETLLEARRDAEERLKSETDVVERLHDIGRTLAAELDLQTVLQHVTDTATEMTAAAFGAFFYNAVDDEGESYMLYTISGVPAEAFAGFPMPRNTAIFAPTFAGEGPVRLDDVTVDERFGKAAPHHGLPPGHLPVCSYLAVPVKSRTGEVYGGLFFGHPEKGAFTEVHERFVVGIATHAAIAIDNARLYESERRTREAAEAARRRVTLLADAGRALTASLDVRRTLADLATLVIPEVADSCVIYLVGDDDGFIEQAVAYAGPGRPGVHDARFEPLDPKHPSHPVANVVRSGASQLIESIPTDLIDAALDDDTERRFVNELNPTSAVIVPLKTGSEVVGAMALGTLADSGRTLDHSDLDLVEELARRAATAVVHARLFARQRDVAQTLQHSLLPEELPIVPGIETAVRYVAGGPGTEVGGDWYDVLAFVDGRLALAMGDVVGRGIPAASLMGQLRNALRALAYEDFTPSHLLRRLNALANELGGPTCMATLLYAVFDPASGSLCLANAGHPPPLILTAEGDVRFIEETLGPPLGALDRPVFKELTVPMAPGDTLFFYTDGLVEDRSSSLEQGLQRLASAVQDGPRELEALCDRVLEAALHSEEEGTDDSALLAIRFQSLADELWFELPTRPAVLRPLRATLRRWLDEGGASEQEIFEIVVAVGEACANAIQHGSMGAETFELSASRAECVRVSVRDSGQWREKPRDDYGRGLDMMRQFMDEVAIERSAHGTEVLLRRTLTREEALA
jgi:serine phosphatase RsbU (regulator of sigma subunit)/anti-sigma regulatory factor (Ser/Thr protein kinase)